MLATLFVGDIPQGLSVAPWVDFFAPLRLAIKSGNPEIVEEVIDIIGYKVSLYQ